MYSRKFDIKDEEIFQLLRDISDWYGYDFTEYSKASMKRRILRLINLDNFANFNSFRNRIKLDEVYFLRFVEEITVNVTEMFRDPKFFRSLREDVLPNIAHHSFIKIWHAGCATGEEVYSMAILLHEAGLLEKSLLYATDLNAQVLETVSKGIYPLRHMKLYSENYINSGGKFDFSNYYTANYDNVKFSKFLVQRLVTSTHNLVSDGSFNEFQLILCRNVLIYFEKQLQDRAIRLFDASLEVGGYLALGSKEALKYVDVYKRYQHVGKEKIWKKLS
ncbi:CheR family methyltransferase [Gynurincola endophyticus]|jgi:chemotaxis protein methyltransferase CheR|uniref:CheR family methyltransferase n=1 Tax=Gynurincola endophyticus TaxID=2479004 RepID=UPI000F8E03E9|nr:protein-glutamate O-methyltransferase CheR [Gynurincola endophyticus]